MPKPLESSTPAGRVRQPLLTGRRKSSDQRRREILDAALDGFASRGFAAITMAEIRERAGASTGSIYHHFKSKEQLAAELYLDGVRDMQEHGLQALLRQQSAEQGIRALVEAYLAWVEQQPKLAAFLFAMRHADFLDAVESDLHRIQRDGIANAADWFRARMLSGELPNVTPDILRAVLYGPAAHYAQRWARSQADVEMKVAKKQLATAAWHALQALQRTRP
jgi:AcrR family transcriptional regulator